MLENKNNLVYLLGTLGLLFIFIGAWFNINSIFTIAIPAVLFIAAGLASFYYTKDYLKRSVGVIEIIVGLFLLFMFLGNLLIAG
jgi:hypothetical protein